MKKRIGRNLLTAICVTLCLCVFLAYSATAKSPRRTKVGRYVNPELGYSVEYDAGKITTDQRLGGPFVFIRTASQGLPSLSISHSPSRLGTALQDTTQAISNSLQMMVPGAIVHKVLNQKLVELGDKTQANYFEIKWNDSKRELITAFVVALKRNRMIVVSASQNPKESTDAISAMVKSLRFDVKVDLADLRKKGYGKDGTFVRTDSPAFKLEYPKKYKNLPLQPGQIFGAGVPGGTPSIAISIVPLKPDADIDKQLKAFAAIYAGYLKPIGSDVKIVANEPIGDYGKHKAFRFEISWKFRGQFLLTTIGHLIVKENQGILLSGHAVFNIKEVLGIFKNIDLNP
ncbi:MAG: hypothetical protein GY866_06050 [Proteobacteria bacterium]|nr:hypothetical protein [Pseudomonadota bacterium]